MYILYSVYHDKHCMHLLQYLLLDCSIPVVEVNHWTTTMHSMHCIVLCLNEMFREHCSSNLVRQY